MDNSKVKSSIKQDLSDIISIVHNVERLMYKIDHIDSNCSTWGDIIREYKSLKSIVDENRFEFSYRLTLSKITDSWKELEENSNSKVAASNAIQLLKECTAFNLALIDKLSGLC